MTSLDGLLLDWDLPSRLHGRIKKSIGASGTLPRYRLGKFIHHVPKSHFVGGHRPAVSSFRLSLQHEL
jgi:hypothetical protein